MKLEDLFLEIVQINSESFDEKEMSLFVQNFLKGRKVNYKVDNLNQICLKIDGKGEKAKEPILFCTHLDTVPPGKNIKPIIQKNGKIVSKTDTVLGADNKAIVAILLNLIDWVIKNPPKDFHTLEFVFTVQEEAYPSGSSQFDFSLTESKVGFVFDIANRNTLNQVVTQASYFDEFTIEFFGKGAHASRPDKGKNTLLMLNKFLNQIELGTPYPNSTLNVGTINGGDANNTIPSHIKITGDYRSEDAEFLKKINQDIKTAIRTVLNNQTFNGCKIEFNTYPYCKGYKHNINSENYKRLEKVYHSVGFESLTPIKTQSASDANTLNNLPKPIQVFCLADGCFETHTTNEYTTVENLNKLYQIAKKLTIGY